MARVRQARRCRARRSDRKPCRAFAIVGGTVCRVHGGSAPRVRRAAERRVAMAAVLREYEAARRRWREDMVKWMTERIIVTSNLLGIPVERVTPADIFECRIVHGVPGTPEPVMRKDRRYGRQADRAAFRVA